PGRVVHPDALPLAELEGEVRVGEPAQVVVLEGPAVRQLDGTAHRKREAAGGVLGPHAELEGEVAQPLPRAGVERVDVLGVREAPDWPLPRLARRSLEADLPDLRLV